MVYTPYKLSMVIWGMVYYCYTVYPQNITLLTFFHLILGSLHIHSLALQTLSAKTPLVLADAGT